MLVNMLTIGTRKGEELKTPRHASAAATRDDRLPHSRQLLKDELPKGDLGGATTILLKTVSFSRDVTLLLPSLDKPY